MNSPAPDVIAFATHKHSYKYFSQLAINVPIKVKVLWYSSAGSISSIFSIGWSNLPHQELNVIAKDRVEASWRRHNRQGYNLLRTLYHWVKEWEARLMFAKYYRCLNRVSNTANNRVGNKEARMLVAIWSGYKFSQRIASLAANKLGMKVAYFENGLMPGTTTLDDKGINYCNSLPRTADFYKSMTLSPTSLPQKLLKRDTDINKKVVGELVELPQRYVFVPFQVNIDSQILVHSPWIKGMKQLFKILLAVWEGIQDEQLSLVIKEHPSCSDSYEEERLIAASHSRILFANLNNTQELINQAQAVVTINSTVGLESLLLGKKVISLGNACYNLAGLTQTAASSDELQLAINAIDTWRIDEELRDKFLRFVYQKYCIPDDYQAPRSAHWQAVDSRLRKMIMNEAWL